MARPRTKFDLEQVEQLASRMATNDDIAYATGCTPRTVIRAYQSSSAFHDAIERGRAKSRISLRQKQLELALAGNATMLIWLGKQYLGQKDKLETENKAEINITVQRATEELRAIPRGQLLAALELMQSPVIDNAIESSADPDTKATPTPCTD